MVGISWLLHGERGKPFSLTSVIFKSFLFTYYLAVLGLQCGTGFSLVAGHELLTAAASLIVERGLQDLKPSVGGQVGSAAAAPWLGCVGFVALPYVGSSQIRD